MNGNLTWEEGYLGKLSLHYVKNLEQLVQICLNINLASSSRFRDRIIIPVQTAILLQDWLAWTNLFRQQISLVRHKRILFPKWGLIFASLYVCKSQSILYDLGNPIAPLHLSCFRQQMLKLLSLSAQLERNRGQMLTAMCTVQRISIFSQFFSQASFSPAGTGGPRAAGRGRARGG